VRIGVGIYYEMHYENGVGILLDLHVVLGSIHRFSFD
jgi:hypothetical protein